MPRVQASCQTTLLNSCFPTENKSVLFASGFWPWAISTALLATGTGMWSHPLAPMGQPELVRGGQGHPCPPLCMGQAPPHTSCCIWPQHSKTEGQYQAGTTSFVLGASNKLPLSCGGIMHVPPAGRGGGEGPCQGDMQHLPLQLPSQQQPGPTPNM